MIDQKTIEVQTLRQGVKTYIIRTAPATVGAKLMMELGVNAAPKIGDIAKAAETLALMMQHVGVTINPGDASEKVLWLTTEALVDNHVPDAETLFKLAGHWLDYNTSFFNSGTLHKLATGVPELIGQFLSKAFPNLSASLSPQESPPS